MSKIQSLKKLKLVQDSLLKEKESQEFISTGCATLNILFGGSYDRGIPENKVSMIAAESSLGKSMIGLRIAKNAQKKGKNVVIFDAEKAYSKELEKTLGIDEDKIMVIQETSLETLMYQFQCIVKEIKEELNDFVFIIDSWNVLVSAKTISNVEADKAETVDFTTIKEKNTFAKLLLNSGATVFVVNQIYENLDAFSSDASIPGGKSIYYSATSIVQAVSKAKDKTSDGEIVGAIITAKARKGRFSREHSKLKYLINYNGGINPYFGLLEIALESGHVSKPSNGFYQKKGDEKKYREKEIYNKEFWSPILSDESFKRFVEEKYSFKHNEFNDENLEI